MALAGIFYKAGALVFGGGHVVLPLLRDALVPQDWLSDDSFLAGYGVAQAIPGPVWEEYALAALAAVGGTAIGLVISSVSNSRDQAAVIVPLALAPQLIFGSGLVSALSWYGEKLAQFVIGAYWTRQAMIAALISRESGIMKVDPVHGTLVPVTAHPLDWSIAALCLQTLAWLLLAIAIMHLRYGRKTS